MGMLEVNNCFFFFFVGPFSGCTRIRGFARPGLGLGFMVYVPNNWVPVKGVYRDI